MKRISLSVLALAAGCGNVMQPSTPGGDDDTTMGPDAGMPDVPVDPGALAIVPRAVFDERADTIDFSTDQPVHAHGGTPVMLGGPGCPELYRYAYLLDRTPAFGRDAAPNPLAFTVAMPTAALDPQASAYRVVAGNGDVLKSWTPLGTANGTGTITVALHRDEIAALGTFTGELHFEARVRTTAGAEQLASACWTHHPMVPPLFFDAPYRAAGTLSLAAHSLADPQDHVIDLIDDAGVRDVEVYTQRFIQQTAEPMVLRIAPAAPSGSFSTTVIDGYVIRTNGTQQMPCSEYPQLCDESPLPPAGPGIQRSGALTRGRWVLRVIDYVTRTQIDCPGNTCQIPARAPGGAPRPYILYVTLRDMRDLWPPTVPVAELVVPGAGNVPGIWLNNQVRCQDKRLLIVNGAASYYCAGWTQYGELQAVDRAHLDLAATPIQYLTGPTQTALTPVPNLPGGISMAPPVAWDGGDGPL